MRTEKARAIELRRQGMSYGMIADELNVPKSTLSNWLKDIEYSPNETVLMRIKNGQGTYGLRRREMRIRETAQLFDVGLHEIGDISSRDLWMLGIGLWLGEGSKTLEQIRLANSDPRIIRLFMRWLREICELENANITAAMHLYPDSDDSQAMEYWMGITGLPNEQFRKTQIDMRAGKDPSKVGKSPHGTLHITVASNDTPSKGVRLYRRMMGWVAAVTQK